MTWEDWKLLVYLICIRQPHLVAVQARNMHLELRECFAALLIRSNCCADLWHFAKIWFDNVWHNRVQNGRRWALWLWCFAVWKRLCSCLKFAVKNWLESALMVVTVSSLQTWTARMSKSSRILYRSFLKNREEGKVNCQLPWHCWKASSSSSSSSSAGRVVSFFSVPLERFKVRGVWNWERQGLCITNAGTYKMNHDETRLE